MRFYSLLALLFAISILLFLKPVPAEANANKIPDDAIYSCRDIQSFDLDRAELVYRTYANKVPYIRMNQAMPQDPDLQRYKQTVEDLVEKTPVQVLISGPAENVNVEYRTYEFDQDQNGVVDMIVENYFQGGILVRQRFDLDTNKDGVLDYTAIYDGEMQECVYPSRPISAWPIRPSADIEERIEATEGETSMRQRQHDLSSLSRDERRELLRLLLPHLLGQLQGARGVPISR